MTGHQAREWLGGLGLVDTEGKAALFERVHAAIPAGAAGEVVRSVYVPGRIEVFGKHTDYGGGRTLICAPSRGFCAAVRRRGDRLVRVHDVATSTVIDFPIDAASPTDLRGWPRYVATVVRRVASNFPGHLCGVDLAFASDLPQAAGMSSSSALMVTVLLALAEASNLAATEAWQDAIAVPIELAGYAACVENGADFGRLRGDSGVGTFGGSEDHVAMLCGEAGHLALCAFLPARLERSVPLSRDVVFAIGVSGVVAEKTGAAREAYNAASRRARRLLELWRLDTGGEDPSLAAVLDRGPSARSHLRALAAAEDARGGERLAARLDQFSLESLQILPAAASAVERGDWAQVGALAVESHRAAAEWLGNQVPETNALAETARASGALAASPFGAGFGGSAWALVTRDDTGRIVERWASAYRASCPHAAVNSAFFTVDAGPHAAVR